MVPLRPSPYNCNRGSDMCSGTDANMTGNGTTGYVGITPFDLSTIGQWFQIDAANSPHSTTDNRLPLSQPVGEYNAGSGDFVVYANSASCAVSGITCNARRRR